MLDEIRRVFQQSLRAFREEMKAREPEDQVVEILTAMRREMAAARAAISALQSQKESLRGELERERVALQQCQRRGEMADRIGDEETARLAREFAGRHREKIVILEQKDAALDAELVLRRRESEEMTAKYKDADANRFVLLSQLRQAAAREKDAASAAFQPDPFADMGRMEERISREADLLAALEELDDAPPPPPPGDAQAVEDRLRDLKRQMGRDQH